MICKQLPDIDRFHPGGANCLHSQICVFISSAMLWRNADASSRFEKNVWCRFLIRDVFAGYDGFEQMADAEVFEDLLDNLASSPGGHSQWNFAVIRPHNANDGIDRLNLGDQRQILRFLLARDRQVIN